MKKRESVIVVTILIASAVVVFDLFGSSEIDSASNRPIHVIAASDYSNGNLDPNLAEIRNALIKKLILKHPQSEYYYSDIALRVVGNNYIVVTVGNSGSGALDEAVNRHTGDSTVLGKTSFSTTTKDLILYFDYDHVNYYRFDTPKASILPASQLTRHGETYNSGGDMFVTPVESHTDSILSIKVFDSTKVARNEGTADYIYKEMMILRVPLPDAPF